MLWLLPFSATIYLLSPAQAHLRMGQPAKQPGWPPGSQPAELPGCSMSLVALLWTAPKGPGYQGLQEFTLSCEPSLVHADTIACSRIYGMAKTHTLSATSADALAAWCEMVASRDIPQLADELHLQLTALLWVPLMHYFHTQPHLLFLVHCPSMARID